MHFNLANDVNLLYPNIVNPKVDQVSQDRNPVNVKIVAVYLQDAEDACITCRVIVLDHQRMASVVIVWSRSKMAR